MIGGFELPTGGRIELRGRDVTHEPPDKRPVNMVFQSYALFPHLDVADNIAFGLRAQARRPRRDRAAGPSEALELVHLDRLREAQPHQLSGGQQQRVALARALVNRPERAAPRRAARRARPQAPQAAPDRAQAHPDGRRDHVRVRDPRPGGGAHDERPDRGDEPRARSSSSGRPRSSTTGRRRGSSRTSSARPISCTGRSRRSGRSSRPSGSTRATAAGSARRPGSRPGRRPQPASGGGHDPAPVTAPSTEAEMGATVEQVAYLGNAVQYQVRTARRARPDVLPRRPDRADPRNRSGSPGRPPRHSSSATGRRAWRSDMTTDHDGSSIDLERELVRYMAERRITRRQLLERISAVGAAAALAPIIAACQAAATPSPSHLPRPRRPATPGATAASPSPTETAPPTPVPTPEAELFVYNWDAYIGDTTIPDSRRSTTSGSNTTSSTPPIPRSPRSEGRQGWRLRRDVPGLPEIPALVARRDRSSPST